VATLAQTRCKEREDGIVWVTIHDPNDQRHSQMVERERNGDDKKGTFTFDIVYLHIYIFNFIPTCSSESSSS